MACMSFLSGGLIYLIILYRSKNSNKNSISIRPKIGSAVSEIEEQRKKDTKKKKRKEKIYLFLLTLLYFLAVSLSLKFIPEIIKDKAFSIRIDLIILLYYYIIFSKLFLHEKIYKHRVISIILISLCYFILLIYYLILLIKGDKNSQFNFKSYLIHVIIGSSIQCINTLFDVLAKMFFNINLTEPYLFMFYLGLFGLSILIPFEIIYHFFFKSNIKFLGEGIISQIIIYSGEPVKLIYSFLLIFLGIFTYGSEMLIIYHFTPCHFMISFIIVIVIKNILTWGNDTEQYGGIKYKIIFIIMNIIIAISSLIYNEVIIIKLWSLEKNTAKYISMREKIEYDNLDQFYNEGEDEEVNNNDKIIPFSEL